ncbi:MAG: rRNA maturation RNase YbeY [Candidatus Cloacimonetes bacterium]|nr:rRNA maturation RNase YbeY [Candidatus Cloacimonadota bacterium]MCB5255691.1 rRNA maturation RNase YbeY [Candidatus Cloacimonadota bacterium]MCK9241761.1 rRNA maturation RNase YbeY [Candidatus Cloacimonadota bacterium]MDD3103975.1 rRNA maturation RNase YbeY [Candidatus Cloacimonadota bacterium]MDD3532708.1 rRNA maturation RNase YbeY [Candidatus Cloacimonadota bacterium]
MPDSISANQIQSFAGHILDNEAADTDFEISLLLTDSATMREYNRKYRGVNADTDVLSFEGEELDLKGRKVRFCDIIIDTNQVFRQKGTNTYYEEFWQVLIHALLHLASYDHTKPADKKKMEDAEDNYRKLIPGEFKRGY